MIRSFIKKFFMLMLGNPLQVYDVDKGCKQLLRIDLHHKLHVRPKKINH